MAMTQVAEYGALRAMGDRTALTDGHPLERSRSGSFEVDSRDVKAGPHEQPIRFVTGEQPVTRSHTATQLLLFSEDGLVDALALLAAR
jgi:hypothetical protein